MGGKLSRRERERLALQQEAQEQAPTGEAGILENREIGGDSPGTGNNTDISSEEFKDAGAAAYAADVAEEAGDLPTLATHGTGGVKILKRTLRWFHIVHVLGH